MSAFHPFRTLQHEVLSSQPEHGSVASPEQRLQADADNHEDCGVLGLFQIEDRVAWTDDGGLAHRGIVISLADDGLYAEVRELGQDDTTEVPTWHLHPIE